MERQNEKAANRRRAKMPGPRIRSDATDANKLGNDRDGPDCTGRRVVRKQQLALRHTSGAIFTLWKVTGLIS